MNLSESKVFNKKRKAIQPVAFGVQAALGVRAPHPVQKSFLLRPGA